jgi:hypothetical protein
MTDLERLRAEIKSTGEQLEHWRKIAHDAAEMLHRYGSALRIVAVPKRPDGTYNRSREACELLAKDALSGQGHSIAVDPDAIGMRDPGPYCSQCDTLEHGPEKHARLDVYSSPPTVNHGQTSQKRIEHPCGCWLEGSTQNFCDEHEPDFLKHSSDDSKAWCLCENTAVEGPNCPIHASKVSSDG